MKVFLAFKGEDLPFVEEFNKLLITLNVKTFYYSSDSLPGEITIEKIYEEINQADLCFCFVSKQFLLSQWAKAEITYSRTREINLKRTFLVPILIDSIELPPLLADKTFADFRDRKIDLRSKEVEKVLRVLGGDVNDFRESLAIIGKLNANAIMTMLTSMAEMEIVLNDLVFLCSSAILVKDGKRVMRIRTISESVSFNQVVPKLGQILVDMSKVANNTILDPVRKDMVKKVKRFLVFNSKLTLLAAKHEYDSNIVSEFLDSTIELNRRLSHMHFQTMIIFFNLKVSSYFN